MAGVKLSRDLLSADKLSDQEADRRALLQARRGGSGGGGDDVDDRVVRLEGDVGRLKDDVAELKSDFRLLRTDVGTLRVDVAVLKENVRHLPGKGFIVTSTSTAVILITAAIVLADKLRALIGG